MTSKTFLQGGEASFMSDREHQTTARNIYKGF